MVTRIVVRITPAERASAAEDLNRDDDDDQLHHKTRDDDFDDDYDKYDTKSVGEKICLRKAADGGFCDGRSQNDVSSLCKPNDDAIKDEGTTVDICRPTNTVKKRPLLLEDADDDGKKKLGRKRQKVIDLAGIPPQPPIKSIGTKDRASKYHGVTFNKTMKKWQARISIDGRTHYIGLYDNEEEAAIDYSRAVFKYKAGVTGGKRKQTFIDLAGIQPQPPIKSNRSDGSSKYHGVTFYKATNKWRAQISVDGKQYKIGYYDNEEEAAIDYARAVFKYKARKFIDLTDVPPQSPILRSGIKDGASKSKYQGVTFYKATNKWQAQISVDGKQYKIGYYDNEEEAAIDYSRAVFKYKARKFIDLTDVPPQSPIKSNRSDGSSKYHGVSFKKQAKKWKATISIDGKQHLIGYYDNEEEAAIDYARAAYKYKAGITGGERKQKFIYLTDVPPQSPIKSKRSDGSSKYQGVTFNRASNKWQAQISIDGKRYKIGLYENEEEAAIDYARAVFKYKTEIAQKGTSSARQTEVQHELCSNVGCAEQTQNGGECRHHKPNPQKQKGGCTNHVSVTDISSFSIELVNRGGRIGIYSPEERKARIARFHAKRSTRVFKVVGGEDST